MAVEFLDEPAVVSGGAPQNGFPIAGRGADVGGVEWLDTSTAPGVEFLGEAGEPIAAEVIAQRLKEPAYDPTPAEFKIYKQAHEARGVTQRAGDFLGLAGEAVSGLWDTAWNAAKSAPAMITDPEANNPLVTAAEGVARGISRDAQFAGQIMGKVLNPDQTVFDEAQKFIQQKLYDFRSGATIGPPGIAPQPSKEVLATWRKEFERDHLPDLEYRLFLNQRSQAQAAASQQPQGQTSIVTGRAAPISGAVADAQSLVTSPLMVVPFGKAMTPVKTVSRAIAAKTLEGAGKTFEWVGEKTVQVAKLPERAAGGIAKAVTGSEEAAEKVAQRVAAGGIGATVLSPFIALPGLTETAVAATSGKVAGKTLQAVGESAQAAGRSVAAGPSAYGLFDRIRFDAKAPEWMRRAANAARPLDPAISMAGTVAKGASEGAAIGTALGAAADGEEGAASGFGAGLALGGGGALLGRMAARGQYRAGLEDMDVARWLSSKPEAEIQNLRNLNLTRDQAVQLADVERLARGVVEPGRAGDIDFRYVNDKEFSKLFGGIGKGAQIVEGDRPVVFVNTGYRGRRPVFHEVMHALDALDAFAPQRQQLNRVLFDATDSAGNVLTKGIYSAADVAEFGSQYRSRLNEAAKSEWDLLTPEARQARILSEVRAESFANLLGGGARLLTSRSVRQRVADKMLLADHVSFLGKLRRGLEGMGVKFNAAGDPSEIFVRNGRPITNTPVVDAALRDYLRAKDQISRKLTAGEDGETPEFVVRPQDLVSRGNTGLIDTFRDHDIFARNPDGSVRMMGGVPVLLGEGEIRRVQTKRVEGMMDALARVPSVGEANAVKLKPNGAWEGKYFSDQQLAAFDALPDDVLSPSMKAKLRELNTLAQSDGQQIILDYNAALKGGRYSSGIAPTTRAAVPLTFNISKAGNFYMTTLDTSHFFRKLGDWRKGKPRAFDAWNGDVDAFLRDSFAYLDNHVNGRPGSVNLDADAATAIHKRNVINDFFNVPKGAGNEDLNPVQLSGKGNKDNLIRARRFDRINRITPGAGDKFPVRYDLQKRNFLPAEFPARAGQSDVARSAEAEAVRSGSPKTDRGASAPRSNLSTAAIQKHLRSQATYDLASKVPGPPNLANWLATEYLAVLDRRLNSHSRLPRMAQLQSVAQVAAGTSPQEMSAALTALMLDGQKGAREHLEQRAFMRSVHRALSP